ncbi:hypothetical protein HYV50_04840 [Candidatus Pacearchaeota archaeon]|nr:hypothetical protein [Candidatus Pacearchaeota archaeon]
MDKKTIIIVFTIFFFFIIYLPLINAACSLGANPLKMEAGAKPGQEVVGAWNLYNLYGDRTTHVKVEKTQGPDWKITFDPLLHQASYEVSGEIQTIEENIAIEKSSIVLEIPENLPQEMDYVKHPNQEGYILVKPIDIYITIPENAKIGQNYEFVFEAEGNCFLEAGAAVPGIATQLEFNVKPTTEFYEKPITPVDEEIKEKNETTNPISVGGGITGGAIGVREVATGALLLTALILIIVVFILVSIVKNKKTKRK